MKKILKNIFYFLIISSFTLSLNGCGYKKDPFYLQEPPEGDENVEFIIKEPTK